MSYFETTLATQVSIELSCDFYLVAVQKREDKYGYQ